MRSEMNKGTIVILITILALIIGFFIGRFTANRYYISQIKCLPMD